MGAKFDKLEAKLSGEKGVTNPAGLAASIGRKKYGKENYDKAAAKDKSPKMKKSDWDDLDEMAEEVEKAYGVKAGKGLFGKPPKPRGTGISQGSGASGGYGLKKGGVGSGKRGHKTADYGGVEGGAFGGGPASDSKREIDPANKKKILASDKKAVRGASKDLSHEELQSKIDSHKDLSESEHLSPASRESYAAKHKALLAVQKKKGPKPEAPKQEGSSLSGPFGNIRKGGAGSGKKGHKTQADLEGLKDNMGRHHIMQYGDKGSAFSESGRQGKSEVFHHPSTDSYHVVSEGGGVKHLKDHSDFKRLGAPYKGDPAAEGNKASRQDASGTRPKSDLGKSEIELEIDELSKTMEFATMNPVEEIKKAVMELGPEGLRKAMPNMSEENKELLGDILEDMSKSHKLPLDPPKKLVNVGGENYVEEDVGNDDADEDIFDASVKEGDNEQKHQGGSHDLTQPVDWEGQMIKSLDEFTAEELATFGEVYKAMKMKKDEKEGKEELEKVSASPKLWGSTKPRGVGIYKGEEDDTVAEDVKEIEGKKKVNEVMDEAAPDKKDDILAALRDKKIKKAKEMIKAALKKECPDMMEEKEENVEVMKKKIKKALILALNEEYSDEEIEKAYADMDKGGPGSGRKGHQTDAHGASYDKAGFGNPSKKEAEQKKIDKYNKNSPVKEIDPKTGDVMAEHKDTAAAKRAAKMKKAAVLFAKSKELLDEGEKEFATELFLKAKSMVADVLEMNAGIKKLSQPEPASDAKTTADAVKSPKMAKSIKWYGEENDAFKAGRLGRHNYASSVNGYYDEMIKKSEEVKEEEIKKSFNKNDLNDLIEADMTSDWIKEECNVQMEEFKKSQGSFTRKSFEETDLLKSLGITEEEAEKL